MDGVVHIGKVARFGIFLKSASRWVPDGWVGIKTSSDRCHFWAFQLELDILDTTNIGNGSVGTKLQPLELGRISEISDNSNKNPSKIHHFVFITSSRLLSSHFGTLQKSVFLLCVFFITHINASDERYI